MIISYITMNRLAWERAQKDTDYRQQLERVGKVFLADGRALSDEALLARLASFNMVVNRSRLDELTRRYFSAEELSRDLSEASQFRFRGNEEDWVWIALACLWERWFPDRPSMEMIDDRMQEGYKLLEESQARACAVWSEAWKGMLGAMERLGISRLAEFDVVFNGTNSVFNWSQDFDLHLGNAGVDDPRLLEERIAYCRAVIERSEGWSLSADNFKRGLAESLFRLGRREEGEQLFQQWLKENPTWGWGWIGWADCYRDTAGQDETERAEGVLKEGLTVADVEDREFLLERLAGLYEDTGRAGQAAELRRGLEQLRGPKLTRQTEISGNTLRVKHTFDFGEGGLPVEDLPRLGDFLRGLGAGRSSRPARVGRNAPCPCGSGKKFKKCCGR
jgi:hypothetical protein